jgi:5-methylcytosine-specific restriction endonuclease McrA
LKERPEKAYEYHFNLYAVNEYGDKILMTKDHIHPKSKGGRNHISNYQTMCYPCNQDKSNKI